MSTAAVIHSANMLIDWVEQQAKTPDNDRLIAALTNLRDTAVERIRSEVGTNGH
jgi:hypothetical protein